MPQKLSVDEIVARRKDIASDTATITKAARSPASWNKDTRSARYVMNAQSTDRYGDIVVTAGIDTTQFEKNPVGLLFHSSRSWPIGSWSNLEKVLKGRPPRLEGDLTLLPEGGPIPEIDQAAWMIENGGIRACSIGFRPDWDDVEMILDDEGHWTGGLKFLASELLECSVCSVGASPEALIKDAGGDWRLARELVEEMLDTYARTPEGLLVPREEYEKAYRVTVEKITEDTRAFFKLPEEPIGVTPTEEEKEVFLPSDEVLDAFVDAMKDGDAVRLATGDDGYQLVIVRDGHDAPEYCLALDDRMTIDQVKDVNQSIVDRLAAKLMSADDVPEPPAEKTATTIVVELDMAEAVEKVNALSALVDSVVAKISKFFGSKAAEPEPVIPPAPPTAEAIEEAKAKAMARLERLAIKGLIQA